MYAAEHDSTWPCADADPKTFWGQLKKRTDADGNTGKDPSIYVFGPDMRSRVMVPVGPTPESVESS